MSDKANPTRARTLRERLFAGLLVTLLSFVGGPIAAQVHNESEAGGTAGTGGQLRMELPFALDRIHPGAGTELIGYSAEDREIAVINLKTREVRARQKLDGVPIAMTTFDQRQARFVAVLYRLDNSNVEFAIFGVNGAEFRPIDFADNAVPPWFTRPRLAWVHADDPFSIGSLVIWDASLTQDRYEMIAVSREGRVSMGLKEYPNALVSVGAGPQMLALRPDVDRATIIDLVESERTFSADTIRVEELGYRNPDHRSVFVPGAPYGGSGSVVIANGDLGHLTVLTVQRGFDVLIDPPLRIGLDRLPALAQGNRQLKVVADRGLSFILVGAVGDARLDVFRRLKGGLAYNDPIELDIPIRDMTVLHEASETAPELFVFLSADGREILAGDISALWDAQRSGSSTGNTRGIEISVVDPSDVILNPSDIARVQRVLGSLGYSVGGVDGVSGPRTQAAIRSFQFDRKLEPSGELTPETLDALGVALRRESQSDEEVSYFEDYAAFLDTAMGRGSYADRLLALGVSQEDPTHPCFGLNALPPREMWPGSVKFARILRMLEEDLGLFVQIVSGFRTAAYNRCINDDPENGHLTFQAFDIALADDGSAEERSEKLLSAILALGNEGKISGTFRVLGSSIHLQPTIGVNHAMIATYSKTERGCNAAKEDVTEFAKLLAGSPASGFALLVSDRVEDGYYSVSVDLHDMEGLAEEAVAVIRKMAPLSADRRTGADAYLRKSDGWRINPDCSRILVIE